jgi:predicted metal-dependent hydrolase
MFKALALCPDARVVKPDMQKYVGVGRQVRAMMLDLTPLVEPLSIDEAFLDLTGTQRLHRASPALSLARLAQRIEREIGINISVGLSYCKFLAKIASELDKPRGFAVIGKAEAKAFLARHLDWLAAKLPPEAAEYLADGAIVPIRGTPHRVRASGSLRGTVKISRDGDGVATLVVPGAAESRRRRVEDHLRAVARDDLALAVDHHAASLGVRPRAIRLKDTTSRWGSASASGTLSFSWRLAMAPPFVLDYLAAHEVAHLKEMNHSERFWAICRRLAPRTDEAQAWLKAHGRELHRAI